MKALVTLTLITLGNGPLGSSQSSTVSEAMDRLNKQFLYLLATIADKIDPAITSVRDDLRSSSALTQTFGLSFLVGGSQDILGDFLGNNRAADALLSDPMFVFDSGYTFGYVMGFGGPYLLPTYLPNLNFDCSSQDFLDVVEKHDFARGGLSKSQQSQMDRFGLEAKQALFCLLQYSKDYVEAAEIGYLIEDTVEAGRQYLRLKQLL